ncbi:hypothetical protein VINI7043_17049 [Vibrio nigripulchritudo ATCC 27043]|nr:hypothetical protein VINI7043_17049 [Vibrio nigripulchritudo ATCC 27043]
MASFTIEKRTLKSGESRFKVTIFVKKADGLYTVNRKLSEKRKSLEHTERTEFKTLKLKGYSEQKQSP